LPVLKIYFERFGRMTGLSREKILDRLPYLGLDIESVESDSVRIEYNPNRADFSSDYGIARALKGLVGLEKGLPLYKVVSGKTIVNVDVNLAKVRPYIVCAAAKGLRMDDETVRQLISMQEDLHNGIGRKRKKVSIGLHNMDVIVPPITYRGMPGSFEFTPLGSNKKMTIEGILKGTETGTAYGHILKGASTYPVLYDSKEVVLSFPPIINGVDTKVDAGTRNLFMDVTSTDERVGDEALAILCAALADAGGSIESVSIVQAGNARMTPDLTPTRMRFDTELTRAITGLDLTPSQMRDCLRSSRLDLEGGYALIPRYRVDILHPVDLTEEVAIGYGLDRIEPSYPASGDVGGFNPLVVALDGVSEWMSRAGFIETMNYDLVDEVSLYGRFSRPSHEKIEVENPRTIEHYLLRDSMMPSLLSVLSRSVNAAYPQKVFEVGRVYIREGTIIVERPHLAALVAHSSSSFSEAKMYLEALVKEKIGGALLTTTGSHWAFAEGRCAGIIVDGKKVGQIGELKPFTVAAFGLDVPVAGFEMDLSGLA
jgi:phenylalanyl-tRNA synthetase beta chain